MVKYKLELKGYKNITDIIKEEADDSYDGTSSFYEKRIVAKESVIYIYILERYFFRIGSNLTITIILEENDSVSKIEIIASGGGAGLANSTFGAENAAAKRLVKRLKEIGYKEIQ